MTTKFLRPAVRFAGDSDSIVEGLAIPFGGPLRGDTDVYRTRFDKANLHLDWFDSRPILYDHGQNDGPQLSVVGTVRTADITDYDDGTVMGKWVRGELDKSNEYHGAIAALLKEGALGWSHGTLSYLMDAEPPARDGTRNITEWPVIEFSLTPREASPFYASASLRGVDEEAVLRILGASEDEIAVRGWLPEGTTEGDLDDGDFAWVATDKDLPDSQRRKLPYKVHGKVDEAGWKAAWSRAHQDGTDFSGGPSQADVIKKLLADAPPGVDTKYDGPNGEPLPEGRSFRSSAANDAQSGAYALASILALMGDEADEADQLAMLQQSADALKSWIDAEQAEIGTPADDDESYWMSANRAGARNSAADQTHLDAAHAALATAHGHLMAIGAHGHTADEGAEPPDDEGGGSDDDTTDGTGPLDDGRSADLLPRGVLRVLSDAEATERQTWLDAARAVGREHAATLRRT